MGLFSRNYDRPGPGIPKDMPRKKGAARFFELLFRDFADYVKLSFLFCVSLLPSLILFLLGAFTFILRMGENGGEIILVFILLSLILAIPVGGVWTACFFNITRFMRDDPSYLWFDFKRKFKENWKQAAPTGVVCTAFCYLQALLWVQLYYESIAGEYTGGIVLVALALFSLLMFSMITPYIFLHFAYVDLKTSSILKNSVLMAIARLPKSFMGALLGNSINILFIFFAPQSFIILPMIPIILAAVSMLLTLTWIWPPFDKYFDVEETLKKKKESKSKEKEEAKEEAKV